MANSTRPRVSPLSINTDQDFGTFDERLEPTPLLNANEENSVPKMPFNESIEAHAQITRETKPWKSLENVPQSNINMGLDVTKSDVELMSLTSQSRGQSVMSENISTRLHNTLYSGRPLKYTAIALGLWHPFGCWSIASLLITIPIVLFLFAGEAVTVFWCRPTSRYVNYSFCLIADSDSSHVTSSEYDIYQFTRFVVVASQVLSLLMMCYCVRKSSGRPKTLQLSAAYNLVKKNRWGAVNLILTSSLVLLTTAVLLRKCCPLGVQCDSCDSKVFIWYFFIALMLWFTVVGCLVFGMIVNGLITLTKQCIQRIFTVEGDSVNCYIAIHQDLCCTIAATVGSYKKWFLLNTACHFWLVLYFAVILLTSSNDSISWTSYYYICVLLIYSIFVCIHPWISTASLTKEFNSMIRKLNTNIEWSPRHSFHNRSQLNDFVQYAMNTQCQFSEISCSLTLPFLSIFLALCGLGLRLFQ